MIERSSPGTSEMIRLTTRAGAAASARRPPLIAERCLRTQFISPISAPLFKSARLIVRLSSSVRPGAGAASSADPPPEIRQSTRSSAVETPHALENAQRRRLARRIGHGMRGLDNLDMFGRRAMAVARDDEPFERPGPRRLDRGGHGCRRLARADDDGAAFRGRGKNCAIRLAGEAASIAACKRLVKKARGSSISSAPTRPRATPSLSRNSPSSPAPAPSPNDPTQRRHARRRN